MKKPVILSLIILLNFRLFAQDHKLELGITGGPSYCLMFGNEFYSDVYNPAVNFSGGISVQYNFSPLLSLHTDILFERKGASSEMQLTDHVGNVIGAIDYKFNYDYMSVPLLLRASIGKKVKFFFNAGPYAALLLRQIATYKTGIQIAAPGMLSQDNTDHFKPLDFGISTGFGLNLRLREKLGISFEARNNFGLVNISALPVYGGGAIKHNTTVILIGLNYCIGGKKD